MNFIEKKIADAAQQYYTDGSSPLSDAEFDALVDELKQTNPNSEVLKTGWGYSVSADSTPGEKFRHLYGTAGSLSKCRTWDEIPKEFGGVKVDASLKLDGISVVLYYRENKLVRALTRGDGEIGIDITNKIRYANLAPETLAYTDPYKPFTGAIRGEILMSFENFEEFKEANPEAKNPRNSVAGLINAKEISSDLKFLNIVVYSIVGQEVWPSGWQEQSRMGIVRELLADMFGADNVVPHRQVILNATNLLETMGKLRDEWYGVYPADGIVLTLDKLPITGTEEVVYSALAFKFRSEVKEAEVVEVIWKMSKTRYAQPKLRIKPIELAGTTVQFATGYHAQWIKENNIGPGTIVTIEKRGEIIPNVNEVVRSTVAQIPTVCPDCGQPLSWDGVRLVCKNESCANATIQDTLAWIHHIAPTDRLGDKLIVKFLDYLIGVNELKDASIESIMEHPTLEHTMPMSSQFRWFEDMWKRLHEGDVKSSDALQALNVPRFGTLTCLKLSEYPELIEKVVNRTATYFDLFPVVGDATSSNYSSYCTKFDRLRYLADRIKVEPILNSSGIKVAITGTLSMKRSDFESILRQHGFKPGEMSKDTKYLITNDPNSNSSKNQKAKAWGVEVIDEASFHDRFLI